MPKDSLAFDADVSEGRALAGFLTELSTQIKTDRHLAPVIEMTHSKMSDAFIDHMMLVAPAAEESFHHVYEWESIGVPAARLWKDVLRGRGANRTATFEWRASKTTVPIPDIEEGPNGEQLQRAHVFVWKAPVMEYDMRVNIRPKDAKALAFPTGDSNNPLWFSRKAVTFLPGRQQMASGESRIAKMDGGTAGKFTVKYASWWGGQEGAQVFDSQVRSIIENNFGKLPIEKTVAPFRRATAKSFKLSVAGDGNKAYKYGKKKARDWLVDRDRDYYAAAKARRHQ